MARCQPATVGAVVAIFRAAPKDTLAKVIEIFLASRDETAALCLALARDEMRVRTLRRVK
jgi:hypothetical protein